MSNGKKSFFEKAYNPFLQGGLILGSSLFCIILGKLIQWTGLAEVDVRLPWTIAATFLLFFALFNSIFSLSSKKLEKYWGRSIVSFIVLAVVSGLAAWFFSSLTINEAGSFRWIFFVLTIGYLVFLSVMGFAKTIVEFAQKEEWNQPRIRNKTIKKK